MGSGHLIRPRSAAAILLSVVTAATPSAGLAWGAIGHRIVGLVADHGLDTGARNAVRQIMGSSSSATSRTGWTKCVRRRKASE